MPYITKKFGFYYDKDNGTANCVHNENTDNSISFDPFVFNDNALNPRVIISVNNFILNITYTDTSFDSTQPLPGSPPGAPSVRTDIETILTSFLGVLDIPAPPKTFTMSIIFNDLGDTPTLAMGAANFAFNLSPSDINTIFDIPASVTTLDANTNTITNNVTPIATTTQNQIYATTPVSGTQFMVTVNTNAAVWNTTFYDMSDNFTNNLNLFSFKGVFVHETMHCMGFINFFGSFGPSFLNSIFAEYLFSNGGGTLLPTSQVPTSQSDFDTFTRINSTSSGVDPTAYGQVVFANGLGFYVNIDNPSLSHWQFANGANGIMEPLTFRGGIPFSIFDMSALTLLRWGTFAVSCIHPGAKVATPKGLVNIEDIRKGDIVIDENNNEVEVITNLKFTHSGKSQYVYFKKNCFGDNKPDDDIKITYGHTLKVNSDDEPKECEKFEANDSILHLSKDSSEDPTAVYTLATENGAFIKTNNIFVYAWNYDLFNKIYQESLGKGLNFPHTRL